MIKPELKEIADYMNSQEEALLFYSHYESIGWKVGKNPMKKWKSAASGWLTRNKKRGSKVEKAISNTNNTIIDRLWVRMSQIYGSKWVINYGTEPSRPWVDFVTNLPNEKIAHGLNEIIKEGLDWPPSLAKFNQMCQSYRPSLLTVDYGLNKKEIMRLRDVTSKTRAIEMNRIRNIIS